MRWVSCLPELGRFASLVNKFTPAEARMECRTEIKPGPAIQQADAPTNEPRRTLKIEKNYKIEQIFFLNMAVKKRRILR